MKSAALMLTWMASLGLAFGQGSVVDFNNNNLTDGDHKVYGCVFDFGGGQPLLGTNYVAELYYVDPATSSLTPFAGSISRFRLSTTVFPGTWSGKSVTWPVGGVGVPLTFNVRVWDQGGPGNGVPGFATYEQALAGRLTGANTLTAESGNFSFTQAAGSPPPLDASFMVNMPAFAAFLECPEPTITVIAFVGIFGLLSIRRLK